MAAKLKSLNAKKELLILAGATICIAIMIGLGLWLLFAKTGNEQASVVDTEVQTESELLAEETEVEEESPEEDVFVAPENYATIVTVSINPKMNLYLDEFDKVLAIEKLNKDADILLKEMQWEGLKVTDCLQQIVDIACDTGYLEEGKKVQVVIQETVKEEVEVLEELLTKMQEAVMEAVKENDITVSLEIGLKDTTEVVNNIIEEVKNIVSVKPEKSNADTEEEKPEIIIPVVPEVKPAYQLVWEDNFNGDALNLEDWNIELHDPGWVNAEWQEYVDSEENIYVKDGKLVIQAVKTVDETGNAYYTSGRVNTQNKHDFKYGKFEARIKVPSGKGFLPAFWMMPTDENYYGQWPKCGEIDIMEVMGQSTDTLHGTIHFGEPHTQKQGTYVAKDDDFSEEFHVFSCEWEPGEIRWYVDGKLYHTANDWFTAKPGFDEVAYPAPFDQPFYMILNLAVGGSWVGYPDETTGFGENAQLVVDYVKVYQKESYDENVVKPEKAPIQFKEPDATGNYVVNGNFALAEDLSDSKDWGFLLAGSGEATATISESALHIVTTNAGDLDYSVQVVQPDMSLQQGKRYRLSYEAYADEARTMITDVTAPDYNYVRYLEDTKVSLTTEKQQYSHEFDMTVRDDANGRIEFNLGNQGSTATVHISNVRLEVVGTCEIPSDEKSVLPDGNYVYNGDFSYGANRLDYWTVPSSNMSGSSVSVTNINGVRELKVVTPNNVTALNQVIVEQNELALSAGTKYMLTFDAHADSEEVIKAVIAGNEFECEIGNATKAYTYSFVAGDTTEDYVLQFLLGTPGTTYIDNVRIQEDGMLVNGGFTNGLVGFETYKDASTNASFSVDELNEGGAACIDIKDTGDQDWKIQLKQNNVTLEEGKWYKISFDAKSVTALGSSGAAFERDIMCALQRNGAVHKNPDGSEDWTPYLQKTVSLNGEYQRFNFVFQMMPGTEPKTDEGTILTFSMGAVGGKRITEQHIVVLDNIVLEEVEAPEQEEITAGTQLISNGNFANGAEGWSQEIIAPAEASTVCEDGKITFNITNPGEKDWNVKLQQRELTLEQGATYEVKFNIVSSESRMVKWGLMTSTCDIWYMGEDMELAAGEVRQVSYTAKAEKPTRSDVDFYISMGKIEGMETPASVITISDISIVKTSEGTVQPPVEPEVPEVPEVPAGSELVVNGDFSEGENGWYASYIHVASATATKNFADGKAVFAIENAGEANWNVKLEQNTLALEQGVTYKVSFKIKSGIARNVDIAVQNANDAWLGGTTVEVGTNPEEWQLVEFEVTPSSAANRFCVSMGQVDSEPYGAHTIEIDDVSICQKVGVVQPEPPVEPEVPAGSELVVNGDFSEGENGWYASYIHVESATATKNFADGKAVFAIENAGEANWNVKLEQNTLSLEQGVTYKVSFKIKSGIARKVDIAVQDAADAWLGGITASVGVNPEEWQLVEFEVTPTGAANRFCVSMGQIDEEAYIAHTIEIDDVSIQKK